MLNHEELLNKSKDFLIINNYIYLLVFKGQLSLGHVAISSSRNT